MQSQSLRPPQPKSPIFEFTKRKRWADLLVTELTEAIILILNSRCQILYCGPSIRELLGWRDDELIDGDFIDLINVDDKTSFQAGFQESIRTRGDMLLYTRLHCKDRYITHQDYSVRPKEVLFEINGYPHFSQGDNECKCFFAMAKPYPSRNTAMLNTFLELKMENQKLQQRLRELRSKHLAEISSIAGPSSGSLSYPTSSLASAMVMTRPVHMLPTQSSIPEYVNTMIFEPIDFKNSDDDSHPEPARKKHKKLYSLDLHVCVTCGRTDSPEWRKGPLGPKTLCNACGLRWAKKMRRSDDPLEGGVAHDYGQT